jgi:hypothetical protein
LKSLEKVLAIIERISVKELLFGKNFFKLGTGPARGGGCRFVRAPPVDWGDAYK